ncbi:hypothetical protein [Cyclobacterium jeungdonense]|uniref:PepSY domain-containing protein n=1 Tax=Cyclobacterium jeungdonense TaxID=708087 RepID=A0ABT8CD92_9BACT|nr:hypothetical protein [Cyclobacterium jeungdonense]MDN3690157.1 hypothetical protein [Cyclobacterium jeungdonense]
MKKNNLKIPIKIAEYLKENFEPGFLFELVRTSRLDSQQVYDIEVIIDNTITKLRINENGTVIKGESEDIFPSDPSDTGEVPA